MTEVHGRSGESELIARYFVPLCHPDASFGLSDDAAFIDIPDDELLVLTKDMLVANVHFLADDAPDLIARKALRVNLSDLAAKGAKPLGYLLGLGLHTEWSDAWLAQFCEGLKDDQSHYDFPLLGGDTVKSPERLTLSITAFGTVPKHRKVLRLGAQPGDNLYVTGTIGDSALGLLVRRDDDGKNFLTDDERSFLEDRFLLPQPRLNCIALVREFASAAMDISDGLIGDAAKMAKAAKVAIAINEGDVPISPQADKWLTHDSKRLATVLNGGDDYELLFAVPANRHDALMSAANSASIKITPVGTVVEGAGVSIVRPTGERINMDAFSAYEHF